MVAHFAHWNETQRRCSGFNRDKANRFARNLNHSFGQFPEENCRDGLQISQNLIEHARLRPRQNASRHVAEPAAPVRCYSTGASRSATAFCSACAFCRLRVRSINSSMRAWNRPERSARKLSSGT